jgi:hypothetical protein
MINERITFDYFQSDPLTQYFATCLPNSDYQNYLEIFPLFFSFSQSEFSYLVYFLIIGGNSPFFGPAQQIEIKEWGHIWLFEVDEIFA